MAEDVPTNKDDEANAMYSKARKASRSRRHAEELDRGIELYTYCD